MSGRSTPRRPIEPGAGPSVTSVSGTNPPSKEGIATPTPNAARGIPRHRGLRNRSHNAGTTRQEQRNEPSHQVMGGDARHDRRPNGPGASPALATSAAPSPSNSTIREVAQYSQWKDEGHYL